MAEQIHPFRPDYAIPPGEILEEMLDARGFKKVEFAARCGRPDKTISEIIAGKTAITPETAIQFERVLGVPASLWTNLEVKYRLRLAEQKEKAALSKHHEWVKRFPLSRMVKFKLISKPSDSTDAVRKLLEFLGVASVEAWSRLFDARAVSYRRSASFKSAPEAVSAWLRWGELEAEGINCDRFDAQRFRAVLLQARSLTMERAEVFQPKLVGLCAAAGVAVVFVPELPGTRLSGAARWLGKDKALVQLSLRHKTDDHLWFTFFHEAGHILLHGKKDYFIDDVKGEKNEKEEEANRFARNILISPAQWANFSRHEIFPNALVKEFAKTQGISPGIVVGRLQYEKLLPYSHLNGLKRRFEWLSQESQNK